MKKTDEALSKAQEQAQIYRELLESGKVRLVPEKPAPSPKQKDEVEQKQAHQ